MCDEPKTRSLGLSNPAFALVQTSNPTPRDLLRSAWEAAWCRRTQKARRSLVRLPDPPRKLLYSQTRFSVMPPVSRFLSHRSPRHRHPLLRGQTQECEPPLRGRGAVPAPVPVPLLCPAHPPQSACVQGSLTRRDTRERNVLRQGWKCVRTQRLL